MQSMALGVIFEYFFGIEFAYGVFIGYGSIALYGMIGGIRGIMAIDVYQFIIFFLIIPIAYAVVSTNFNGVEEVLLKIPKSEFKFEFNFKNIIILISVLFASLMPSISAPYMHRYLMLSETPKKLKTIFNYLFCITVPFMFSIFVIACIMKANYYGTGENIMLKFISDYVPVGLKGFIIVGLFAVIMSTSDSYINSASVALTKDLIKVLYPSLTEKQELRVLRFFILIISIIPLFMLSKNLFELIWIFRACGVYLIIIPFFAALYYFPANLKSFYIGIFTGLIFIYLTLKFLPQYTLLYVLTSQIGVIIGYFGTYYLSVVKKYAIKDLFIEIYIFFKIKRKIFKREYEKIPLKKKIKEIFTKQEPLYNRFSMFALCYFFIYSFYLKENSLSLLVLTVISYLLVFSLIFRDILFSHRFKKKIIIYYYFFTVTFCLPFTASYMFFNNGHNSFWAVNGIMSILLLYQFLNVIGFLISLTIGFTLGCIIFFIINFNNFVFDLANFALLLYVYLSFIFIGLFLIKKKEVKLQKKEDEQQKQLEMTEMFANLISHEIQSPISIIYGYIQLLNEEFNQAKKEEFKDDYQYDLTKTRVTSIEKIGKDIEKISLYGLNTIEILLSVLSQAVRRIPKDVYPIRDCIYESVEDCKLFMPHAGNINIKISEKFNVRCSYNALKFIFINLIKNTYNHNGADTRIEIRTEKDKPGTIFFIDYGKGIDEKNIKMIFNKYFNNSESGTGLGLAYCKLIMEDLNGSINCYSSINKYTVFTLKFPYLYN